MIQSSVILCALRTVREHEPARGGADESTRGKNSTASIR